MATSGYNNKIYSFFEIFLIWTISKTLVVVQSNNELLLQKAAKEAKVEPSELDAKILFQVAKTWNEKRNNNDDNDVIIDDDDYNDSIVLYHLLADSHDHILSMVKLGHYYSEQKEEINKAIKYFATAGENGPHHASLYNAGRLLAQQGDWVGALAYLKAAVTLNEHYPSDYISESVTQSALEAYEIISQRISKEAELTIVEIADIFLFGNLQDLPSDIETHWSEAVMGLVQFNQTFVESVGQHQDFNAMTQVVQSLRTIWEANGTRNFLSKLQAYLLLDNINDMLGPLAGLDDVYVPMAAGYAEALSKFSIYCWEQFAITESDPACFNGAAASAMSYYRRMDDEESAKRVLQLANEHPFASTHWILMEQTPRVFHPELTAKPWWDAKDFSAAQTLQELYKSSKKQQQQLLKELEAVKQLQEGRLRGSNPSPLSSDKDDEIISNDNNNDGTVSGLQRIFTPYIGVRTKEAETQQTGAGGWAEFGPLYDGNEWNEANCEVVPTICNALKNDKSLCTARKGSSSSSLEQDTNVWELCGADTVVTILRLRPGTSILPHCGTTNSRLIMHFPLVGAQGVEFTVGGEVVKNYGKGDGHAIVFDDSFEHSVYHGGKQDRFVVLAVLSHPDLL